MTQMSHSVGDNWGVIKKHRTHNHKQKYKRRKEKQEIISIIITFKN
jgi:hypothetical protein